MSSRAFRFAGVAGEPRPPELSPDSAIGRPRDDSDSSHLKVSSKAVTA